MRKSMKSIAVHDLIWMAGFFDGEGYVGIQWRQRPSMSKSVFHLSVSLTNTDFAVLEWLCKTTGLGSVYRKSGRTGTNQKSTRAWLLDSYAAEQFIRAIQPYSKCKSKEIALALEARGLLQKRPYYPVSETDHQRLVEIWERCGSLKGGSGPSRKRPPSKRPDSPRRAA